MSESVPLHIRPTEGIRVQMAAVDLTAPEQILYSYKLDGADGDWVHLGHQANLEIKPLRSGRYTLRLRSTNGGGLEVDNERRFTIIVRRNMLQSAWFGIILLVAATLAATLLTQRRNKRNNPASDPEDPLLHGLHGEDRRFVESFTAFLNEHLDDGGLDVPQICEGLGVSRSVLFGRCRTLLGTTPATFLRRLRLERARELIREGGRSMTDVSYAIGINDPHYFSKIFKKAFGVTPSQFKQQPES